MGMGKFIIRRILAAIPVLLLTTFVAFVLIRSIPGGPFSQTSAGRRLPERIVERLEQQYGLNQPVLIQFGNYLLSLIRLDFGPALGTQYRDEDVSVNQVIAMRLPVSIQVGIMSVIVGFAIGVPLGVLAAIYHNSAIDFGATFFAVLGQSIPALVLAPVLIIIFAVKLNWLPVADMGGVWRSTLENPSVIFSWDYLSLAILPVFALGTGMSAGIARLTRASLLQVMREDYIRTARAKGLKERVVIYGHALKNALIPVATIVGPLLAGVLTGTFIIERIFNIPGLGREFVQCVGSRDYNLLVGLTVVYSVFLVSGNILVDIMYTWLDPRIRFD